MTVSRLFVDISLLRTNANFRHVLLARTISLMGLGMLAVSVPIQVYAITGSSFQVGIVAALDGAGMFAGLLLGGVLADLYDRRRLILFARSICGLGFVALAVNSAFASPSVVAICALAFWDGFFGALGVSALMAAMPHIVGRENLMQAGALGMMTGRFASIISPALGGMIIAWVGLTWNYGIAAVGTLLTVLTLLSLPRMVPERHEIEHPLRMLAQAFVFLFRQRLLLGIFAIGTLLTLTSSIRILFPALASGPFGGGAFETGLMYSAVPIGATAGAVLSGWARNLERPDLVMLGMCMLAFGCVVALGAGGHIYFALPALAVYGYATAIASLLQYTMIQAHTPDSYLGRVNSLWAAQDTLGDIVGALAIGAIANVFLPAQSILLLGVTALALGLLLALLFRAMRRAGLIDLRAGLEGASS
ncbi:enterobactin transporter EntS [Mesorhizobium sp. CGMCC 1.15528]|uniref:Enterobactin transporter EntS n=1 Tax=Mesorhizobium zhangyense TaxID=1776730 RepID=A0A7C9R9H7_9HYPH|nr:enterobactin transporter EntS [Mesorhizobium zhangyense]NGN43119.1 enterobactin transporter EntS [Mesorhizobium zhangyense]